MLSFDFNPSCLVTNYKNLYKILSINVKVKTNKSFLGDKLLDQKFALELDDQDLLNFSLINSYAHNLCRNQKFWMDKVIYTYGKILIKKDSYLEAKLEIEKKYLHNHCWKDYYFWIKDTLEKTKSIKEYVIPIIDDLNRKDIVDIILYNDSNFLFAYTGFHIEKIDNNNDFKIWVKSFVKSVEILSSYYAKMQLKNNESFNKTLSGQIKRMYNFRNEHEELNKLKECYYSLYNEII